MKRAVIAFVVLAGAAALYTAVPPNEATPEAQELPLKRTIPQVTRHVTVDCAAHLAAVMIRRNRALMTHARDAHICPHTPECL